jgi:hypothetical protein
MAFVNTDVPKATSLVANMQKLVKENEGLRAFVVFVAGPEVKPAIETLAAEKQISIPMTFLPQGKSDVALSRYKINPEAKTTVTVSKGNKVLANWVNVDLENEEQVKQLAAKAKEAAAAGS